MPSPIPESFVDFYRRGVRLFDPKPFVKEQRASAAEKVLADDKSLRD